MNDRIPPQDVVAEKHVLGLALAGGAPYGTAGEHFQKVRSIVKAADFYVPAHATLWRALEAMYAAGKPVEFAAVAAELRGTGQLGAIGQGGGTDADGADYLTELVEGYSFSTGNADYYAGIVRDKSLTRQVIMVCAAMIEACYAAGADAAEVLREAEQRLYALAPSRALGRTLTVAEAAKRVIDRADRVAAGKEPAGLSLGWNDLDVASGGGLRPGQLVVIAASTSIGKTAIALRMAANVAAGGGVVKFFSVEMSADELGARLLAMHSGVNGLLIAQGRVSENDRGRLVNAQAEFARWGRNVELTDRPLTVPQMGAELRRMGHRLNRQIDLAVIDYLQIVPAHEGDNLREKINGITRAAKLMAQELRVPVLLLSQLSRTAQAERRPPELHDLKESSSIEQDADGVILLHRRHDARVDVVSGNVEIDAKIAKWRNGLTTQWGQLSLSFKRATADFYFPRISREAATA
jgi:replicative DNA helicase